MQRKSNNKSNNVFEDKTQHDFIIILHDDFVPAVWCNVWWASTRTVRNEIQEGTEHTLRRLFAKKCIENLFQKKKIRRMNKRTTSRQAGRQAGMQATKLTGRQKA